ncbi:MAG: DUF4249 family protein [Bacteroidales bacterium]|nr:DUF4249 family protein [Lentimicrobiaceae bacterium]MDD5696195.1 DUF4249 family protein [Bacteroidales bacterium]
MKIKYCYLFFLILVTACIDDYWPELDKYESLLVVDGSLTDKPGPCTIRISTTSKINSLPYRPFPGCSVILMDDAGNQELLTETEPGTYTTSQKGIQGVIGRQYGIQIVIPGGKTCSFPFQQLQTSVGIDSVYAEIMYKETADLEIDRRPEIIV